jgi:ribosomal protein L12E/L44/L45/RPP1/RPP2
MREYLPLEGNNLDDALLPGASPRIKSASASAGARAKPAGAPPPAEEC